MGESRNFTWLEPTLKVGGVFIIDHDNLRKALDIVCFLQRQNLQRTKNNS